MAGPTCRNRHDPVARFNTFEVTEDEIKAQLVTAQRAQRALRARSLWLPKATRNSDEDADFQVSASLGRPLPTNRLSLSESPNAEPDLENSTLDRTFSFNSLSTLQRAEEAARLRQYRDSPVSACMTDRTLVETKGKEQDPCPPLSVYTLKQARKDEKEFKKSLKKHKVQQKKSSKTLAGGISPKPIQDGTSSPRRAASDPSYRRPREIASQWIKRLKSNKPMKLVNRPRSSPVEIPHVDDFESKDILRDYLNDSLPETVTVEQPPSDIAELPGSEPPAYTPYHQPLGQPSSAALPTQLESPVITQLQRACSSPISPNCDVGQKMMRCDNCQFGIKYDDAYLHCMTCNGGDRIICDACDTAGFSCRHQLVKRNRNGDHPHKAQSRSPSHDQRDQGRRSTVDTTRTMNNASVYNIELEPNTAPRPKRSEARKKELESKELELQRREQDLVHKEREASLREREGILRVREAEVAAKARESESKNNTDFMRSCMEMAVSLGAQFANMSRSSSNASSAPFSPSSPTMAQPFEPYFPGSTSQQPLSSFLVTDPQFQAHGATKRKAGANGSLSRSESGGTGCPGKNQGTNPWDDGNGDDADDAPSGTPKKPKQDIDGLAATGKLYACHYCKFDPSRYSDRNTQEKWYRSCSSGYWPDISRLKQHLYRVHWRGKYCGQCYSVFKTDEELAEHRRCLNCEPKQCPFPEKFDTNVHAEIKKKRPQQAADQVWYTLWDILFPQTPRPETPYADRTNEQPSQSSTPLATEPQRQALEQLFESRLSQANEEWITPEMRAFLRDQLRESMADLVRSTQSSHSPAPSLTPPQRLSVGPTRPRVTIPAQSNSSAMTSPQPVSALSATSSHSASSARWHHLPNHRRSFSRPLPSRTSHSSMQLPDDRLAPESALTSAVDTTPSEYIFNVSTPSDPENDNWDPSSNSWQQGDELGLAVSTDSFTFPFTNDINGAASECVSRDMSMSMSMNINAHATAAPSGFQPVKLQSLTEPQEPGTTVPTQLKSKLPSEASIDSGYGSARSTNHKHHHHQRCIPSHNGMPIVAQGGWAPPPPGAAPLAPNSNNGSDDEVLAMFNEPMVPDESQINYGALDMSFSEFTAGSAWDVTHSF